jgi:hypothetical protein
MAYQVFISHTKDDVEFLDMFDRVVARVGIKAFRSEFETIEIPQWKTIKKEMENSVAMFLLVGKELTAHQTALSPDWKYTQNWIAYEMGLACQKGIDVWVLCDDGVEINFPVPYFNNYALFGIASKGNFEFIKSILTFYNSGGTFAEPIEGKHIHCPHKDCGINFNLHSQLPEETTIKCPQCLRGMLFKKGFRLVKS